MSIESRWHQYGTVFDHWQKGERLYVSDKKGVAVFRLQHKESGQEESAVKVITLIEGYGKLSEYSPERKVEYETALEERKTEALKEVQFMYALKGYTNIVSYEDRITEHWTESDRFGCDLLIRMELLQDLRKIIRDGRVFPESEIIQIGKDICTALILCHSGKNPIIHRDIKPENIFVNSRGIYKLGDFGISRILDKCQGATATTAIGTEEYIAPEQVQKEYDERVDIYSLGLVLYELSNQNRLPFVETRYPSQYDIQKNLALRMAGNKLPAPSNASAALAKVILKACAFKAGDRYQTAKEMFEALDKLTGSATSCASEPINLSAASISQTFETVPAVVTQDDGNAFATVPAIPSASEVATKTGQPQLLTDDENKTDLQARADLGDAVAQNEMGDNYYYGRGVSIDYAKAFFWYQKAAEQGNILAMSSLGECCYFGKGVKQSYVKAAEWFQKAADAGVPYAEFATGFCYGNGHGVKKNLATAFLWYEKSAKHGNVEALRYLADCYLRGAGTQKDASSAVVWYTKAANNGNVVALRQLGSCYKKGLGVHKDLITAMDYYQRAMEKADFEAAIQYKRILMGASKSEKVKLNAYGHKIENISMKHSEEMALLKKQKTDGMLLFGGMALAPLALVAGCIMWFTSVSLWAIIAITVLFGAIAAVSLYIYDGGCSLKIETLEFSEIAAMCGIGPIGVPLATAIVIALIECVLWFCR